MSAKAAEHHLPASHYHHPQHYDDASPASASASSAPVSAGPSRHNAQYIEPAPRMSSKKSQSRERGTSSLGGQSVEPEDPNKPKVCTVSDILKCCAGYMARHESHEALPVSESDHRRSKDLTV